MSTFVRHLDWITCVSFNEDSDGLWVLTGGKDNKASLFNALSGNHVIDYIGHTNFVTSVAFKPGGQSIVTASIDGSVKVFEKFNGMLIYDLNGHHGPIYSMGISLRGDKTNNNRSTAFNATF